MISLPTSAASSPWLSPSRAFVSSSSIEPSLTPAGFESRSSILRSRHEPGATVHVWSSTRSYAARERVPIAPSLVWEVFKVKPRGVVGGQACAATPAWFCCDIAAQDVRRVESKCVERLVRTKRSCDANSDIAESLSTSTDRGASSEPVSPSELRCASCEAASAVMWAALTPRFAGVGRSTGRMYEVPWALHTRSAAPSCAGELLSK
mmetsp:Transcript_13034/g.41637  ORF Transcript_13034/g.41637 Transcript_13034/m.41637 type:complete len:207 (-) Transcript_13034:493-1113(-)